MGGRSNVPALARLCCGHQEVAGVFQRRPMADAVKGRNLAFGSAVQRAQLAPGQ